MKEVINSTFPEQKPEKGVLLMLTTLQVPTQESIEWLKTRSLLLGTIMIWLYVWDVRSTRSVWTPLKHGLILTSISEVAFGGSSIYTSNVIDSLGDRKYVFATIYSGCLKYKLGVGESLFPSKDKTPNPAASKLLPSKQGGVFGISSIMTNLVGMPHWLGLNIKFTSYVPSTSIELFEKEVMLKSFEGT